MFKVIELVKSDSKHMMNKFECYVYNMLLRSDFV